MPVPVTVKRYAEPARQRRPLPKTLGGAIAVDMNISEKVPGGRFVVWRTRSSAATLVLPRPVSRAPWPVTLMQPLAGLALPQGATAASQRQKGVPMARPSQLSGTPFWFASATRPLMIAMASSTPSPSQS